MTIGDMRRFMLKKVVPEVLVPQNIVDFLIDENSPPPEPDAFTFLTRLRGLGIGSADFLYLLEGCGAPERAVNKIKAHPAMNLQGLIVTLEESGMTSKDYTRILYTARQIWERTLTLRLETSEHLSEEDGADMNVDTAEISADAATAAGAPAAENTAAENNGGNPSDSDDLTRVSLPHKKQSSPYPDATEELMSVDFNSYQDLGEEDAGTDAKTASPAEAPVSEQVPEAPESNRAVTDNDKSRPDNGAGTVGIGSGGAADLFGGSASEGELDYSRRFTESFVNDYMTDFAEDDLGDASDDDDNFDEFGTFYGEVEQSEDDIPEVGSGVRESSPAAEDVPGKKDASAGIPDAREPFEVHIASYDIPDPDEPAEPKKAADSSENEDTYDESPEKRGDDIEFVEATELPKKNTAPFEVVIDYGDEEQASEKPAVPVTVPAPASEESGGYNGETTRLIPINREAVERSMSELAGKIPASADPDNSNAPEDSAEKVKTAVQKPAAKTAKQRPHVPVSDEDEGESKLVNISGNFGRGGASGADYEEDDEERKPSSVKKGIIIAAGIGAAALVGANFAVSHFLGGRDNSIRYANSAEEVFADIYYSYYDENNRVMGGEDMFGYSDDQTEAFGDMIICGTGLGTVTAGNNVYSVSENKITASVFGGDKLDTLGQFEPADGTRFVAAFGTDDSLIVVYNGSGESRSGDCGYLKIQGASVVYTVRQSGRLTDVKFEGNEIKLGSVYTPAFTETFDASRTDIYLPKVGVSDHLTTVPAENVVLSRTAGCSYAISGGYSIDSGAVTVVKAALGDPVFADAEGTFFLNGKEEKSGKDYGLIVSADDPEDNSEKKAKSEKCGKISCAAAFEGGSAVYEQGEEGGETVLRDRELKICSSKMRSADIPDRFAFSGNTLIAFSADNVSFAADCSDINAVKFNNLRLVNGDTDGKSAITLEPDEKGIKLTRYVLENGAVKPAGTFTRELSSEQMKTLACGDKNTIVLGSDRVGAAYSYFDGVSVISEYVTLGTEYEAATLYDDKTGFEYAFEIDGKLRAVCSKGAVDVTARVSSPDGSVITETTP